MFAGQLLQITSAQALHLVRVCSATTSRSFRPPRSSIAVWLPNACVCHTYATAIGLPYLIAAIGRLTAMIDKDDLSNHKGVLRAAEKVQQLPNLVRLPIPPDLQGEGLLQVSHHGVVIDHTPPHWRIDQPWSDRIEQNTRPSPLRADRGAPHSSRQRRFAGVIIIKPRAFAPGNIDRSRLVPLETDPDQIPIHIPEDRGEGGARHRPRLVSAHKKWRRRRATWRPRRQILLRGELAHHRADGRPGDYLVARGARECHCTGRAARASGAAVGRGGGLARDQWQARFVGEPRDLRACSSDRAQLEADAFAAAWAAGRMMTQEQAVAYALEQTPEARFSRSGSPGIG
jgi:hypothetical protein